MGLKALLCVQTLWAQSLCAQPFGFFDNRDLDFWREGKVIKPWVRPWIMPHVQTNLESHQPTHEPLGLSIRQKDHLPFDWKNYFDPKSLEFWDDGGDYVPPRPLREAVANPTPENLKNYTLWQAKRLVVLAQFEQKRLSGSSPMPKSSTPDQHPGLHQRDLRQVQLLYFYQSSCPHCQSEKSQVEALEQKGVRVSYIQLDWDTHPPLHTPSLPYTRSLEKSFSITATPTWIFRRRGQWQKRQGEQSEQEIQTAIEKLFTPGDTP